jgi:hypothetical protein
MIQIAAQIRILVAVEAIDGRKGIDAIAQLWRETLNVDPFSGYLFIFRTRRGTAIRVLQFDGQGFWLATKRLSKGRFRWWRTGTEPARMLQAHQAQLLLVAGNPEAEAPPVWRPLHVEEIHTCELNGANPFDYLTELQRHSEELKQSPSGWMPWNNRETLARLAGPAAA